MSRIWCWLGLHDWLMSYKVHVETWVETTDRVCLRCHRFEDFQQKDDI